MLLTVTPDQSWTESEVRALRDKCYGYQSENEWQACKANWMKPENIQWLLKHQFLVGTL